jgi:hypothetical protein
MVLCSPSPFPAPRPATCTKGEWTHDESSESPSAIGHVYIPRTTLKVFTSQPYPHTSRRRRYLHAPAASRLLRFSSWDISASKLRARARASTTPADSARMSYSCLGLSARPPVCSLQRAPSCSGPGSGAVVTTTAT